MEHEAGSIFNILAASKNGAGKIHNLKKQSIEKRYQDYKNIYFQEEEVIEVVQEQKDDATEEVVVPVKTVLKKKNATLEQYSGNARLSKKERRDAKKNKD